MVRDQKSPNDPQRVKFCCLCGNRGHYADQCNRANRAIGPLSVNVSSYKSLLRTQLNNKAPKCTILVSNLNNYTFNFGNDVTTTGNSIYARFRRAVKLDVNQSITSENDVEFVKESNLHDTSDPPIEVYDDFDFEMDDFDDVSSSDECADTNDDSFVTIDELDDEDENAAGDTTETRANEVDWPINKAAAIKKCNEKIHTLEELKRKMLSQKSDNAINESTESIDNDTIIESDSNVSGQKDDVTTSSALPDFIPLTSKEPERYEVARSPSPECSADSTTNTNDTSDATILLTKQHCKQLLTANGNQFLRDSELKYNISVRLEWRQYGNVLIVRGITSNQQEFHKILKEFFESTEKSQISNQTISLPRNRDALVRFVRNQVALLDSKMCNYKPMADVQGLYARILHNDGNPSKTKRRQNIKMLKHLNMILFGRYGLGEGKSHLDALQECLRRVVNTQNQIVPLECRKKLSEHFDYIFSGTDHKNYADIIAQYNQMKRDRALPPLILDQKLMGLKINVYPNVNNTDTIPKPDISFKNALQSLPNRSSTITSANNQQNKPPSLLDIQINVSTPSTSSSYQNQSMQRQQNLPSNQNHILDKWKY